MHKVESLFFSNPLLQVIQVKFDEHILQFVMHVRQVPPDK